MTAAIATADYLCEPTPAAWAPAKRWCDSHKAGDELYVKFGPLDNLILSEFKNSVDPVTFSIEWDSACTETWDNRDGFSQAFWSIR